ncbi:hypothetical protein KA517_00575 [Candidatus Gracilibacteria bacterium]|nr:hypothetical protein [Candidatus Gracilibacteria bacterium]
MRAVASAHDDQSRTSRNPGILKKALIGLGSSELAAQLYLILLRDQDQSLLGIAKLLEVSRPTLYKCLSELLMLGLVVENGVVKANKHNFRVTSPSRLLELWRQKIEGDQRHEQELLQHLPQLLVEYEQGSQPALVKVLKGSDAFVKLFFQILEEEKEVTEFFGSVEDFIQFISWDQDKKWIKKRISQQMKMRTLLLPSQDTRTLQRADKKELRETRVLVGLAPFETAFQLFANKVILWQPKAPIAVVVEDQFIVKMMKSIFYYCWEQAE